MGLVHPHRPVDGRPLHDGRPAPADAARVRLRRLADRRRLSKADPSAFSVNLSAEKASTLDADLVVFYAEEGAGAEDITGNALLGQIPALKNKQYVASADNAVALSMSLPSPLSVQTAVDEFLPKIVSALNGTPAS